MRFLADESCDFAVVRALRSCGHDVLAISESRQRSVDEEVMELAHTEHRILLTEDKDFGWLAFVRRVHSAGVVLIRFLPLHALRSVRRPSGWLMNLAQSSRELLSFCGLGRFGFRRS